jgi:hypothetical protein
MVKPARVAGEPVGTCESIGRRQNQMPGELLIGHFAFFPMLGSARASRAGERGLAFTNLYSSRADERRVLISPPNFITTARWQTKHHRPAAGCSANGSSYSACRDLESHFSCSFIYVWLAIHRNPSGNLRPYCSCENSQVWRRARGERHCDGGAGFRLHRSCPRYYGHPAACQHDPVGSRAVTTTFH